LDSLVFFIPELHSEIHLEESRRIRGHGVANRENRVLLCHRRIEYRSYT
jgi:hypothetical protein